MKLRRYQPSDCKELAELFYNTVHTVNTKEYTEMTALATGNQKLKKKWI